MSHKIASRPKDKTKQITITCLTQAQTQTQTVQSFAKVLDAMPHQDPPDGQPRRLVRPTLAPTPFRPAPLGPVKEKSHQPPHSPSPSGQPRPTTPALAPQAAGAASTGPPEKHRKCEPNTSRMVFGSHFWCAFGGPGIRHPLTRTVLRTLMSDGLKLSAVHAPEASMSPWLHCQLHNTTALPSKANARQATALSLTEVPKSTRCKMPETTMCYIRSAKKHCKERFMDHEAH